MKCNWNKINSFIISSVIIRRPFTVKKDEKYLRNITRQQTPKKLYPLVRKVTQMITPAIDEITTVLFFCYCLFNFHYCCLCKKNLKTNKTSNVIKQTYFTLIVFNEDIVIIV